jgi:hypothetical protein
MVDKCDRCACGKATKRWTVVLGHTCECGKKCNGKCRPEWVTA